MYNTFPLLPRNTNASFYFQQSIKNIIINIKCLLVFSFCFSE